MTNHEATRDGSTSGKRCDEGGELLKSLRLFWDERKAKQRNGKNSLLFGMPNSRHDEQMDQRNCELIPSELWRTTLMNIEELWPARDSALCSYISNLSWT